MRFGARQVGEHYKQPRRPIFVVCSESHYSVLFSTEPDCSALPGAHLLFPPK